MPRIVVGTAACLTAATVISIALWSVRAHLAAQRQQQYQAALKSLAQLRLERQQIVHDLLRNKNLIAWRESRMNDAKTNVADVRQQSALPRASQIDEDAVFAFDVSIAEDELNLSEARNRREKLDNAKRNIEAQIAVSETLIRRIPPGRSARD